MKSAQNLVMQAFYQGAALGLLVGVMYWLALWGYLYGSSHAWWTGAPGTFGQDWRAILARLGLKPPFWQLPTACTLLGAIFGMLVAGLRVNTQSVWRAFRFGCIAVCKNWYWMLAILLLPLSNLIAVFFTGHQQAYFARPSQFRPQWSFPGWLAVAMCLLVSAAVLFSEIWLSQQLFDAITERTHLFAVAGSLLFLIAMYDAFTHQACAGVWLEKCTTLGSVRLVLRRLWHTVIVRDAIALELLLTLLSLVLLFPPIFLAAIFSTYEAPQLEANMKSAGITPPTAFLLCWELFDLVVAYGFLFLAAPISVFYSICNAKLFQQTHLRE